MEPTITIDMNMRCKRCGGKGASEGGLCLACIVKAIKKGEFDYLIKPDPDRKPNCTCGENPCECPF